VDERALRLSRKRDMMEETMHFLKKITNFFSSPMKKTAQPAIPSELIRELGLEGVSEKMQEEILTEMTELLLKRLALKVFEALPEEEIAQLRTFIKGGQWNQVDEFFRQKLPNYENLLKETVVEFKDDMKEKIAAFKEA
jgi:hypothetical protein